MGDGSVYKVEMICKTYIEERQFREGNWTLSRADIDGIYVFWLCQDVDLGKLFKECHFCHCSSFVRPCHQVQNQATTIGH